MAQTYKLECVASYRSNTVQYRRGDVFEVSHAQYAFLMADSPESFRLVEVPIHPSPVAPVGDAGPEGERGEIEATVPESKMQPLHVVVKPPKGKKSK